MNTLAAQFELNLAQKYYSFMNLFDAKKHARKAVDRYTGLYNNAKHTNQIAMDFLDALTLLQSLLALLHQPEEYLLYEPQVKALICDIFPTDGESLYALHLFDVCESMAISNYLSEAEYYETMALSTLQHLHGESPYFAFMQAYCDARIAFQAEDYYRCVESCHIANDLWYTPEYGQVFPPFMERNAQREAAIDYTGANNVLLLCNAYGKLNNPVDSIAFLENMLEHQAFQGRQLPSAEITLAQLYAIHQDYNAAAPIYHKYRNERMRQYPDMAAALDSLAFLLEQKSVLPAYTAIPDSYCYSHDAINILRYNHALSLADAGRYEQALSQFDQLGSIGYSMVLTLLSHLNRTAEIPSRKDRTNAYFYRQAKEILAHYNEKLVYNHLSQLQYHIDMCLGAYCHCCEDGLPALSPADAYSFLLNTKYLSLEAAYLLRTGEQPLYTANQVCPVLAPHTVLAEFTMLRNLNTLQYGCFLVSRENVQYVPLGDTQSMDALLEKWHQLLQASVTATGTDADILRPEQRSLDTKLRQALFLPLKPYLAQCEQLIIAPAGAMVNFPFCRLSVSAREYLGEQHEISYINTGKELLLHPAVSTDTPAALRHDALIIGNPATLAYPRLPYAEIEADMVADCLHSHSHKGAEVTKELFACHSFQAPQVLHIAAHGVFQPLADEKACDWEQLYTAMKHSGIVLANDDLLSLTDLSELDFSHTELAVLSCCHSGQSTYQATEGAFGLRRILRLAGCSSLVVNLWQSDDAAAFLWMRSFYEALTTTGCALKDAFRQATYTVRNYEQDNQRPYENPYYWAGYLLIQ